MTTSSKTFHTISMKYNCYKQNILLRSLWQVINSSKKIYHQQLYDQELVIKCFTKISLKDDYSKYFTRISRVLACQVQLLFYQYFFYFLNKTR